MVNRVAGWLDGPAASPGGSLAFEEKAPLGSFDVVSGRLLEAESGLHAYAFTASPGVVVQAKVATTAFEPVVVLVAPSGARWDLSDGLRTPDARTESDSRILARDLVLAETGAYRLFVTSRENLDAGRAATDGEYRLTLLCDAPKEIPTSPASSRSGRFASWESEPR